MSANDSPKGTPIGTTRQAVKARAANAMAFEKGHWTWILVVGVVLMLPRPTRAQTQAPPQPETQTQPSSQTPAPTSDASAGRTEGNYTVQQSIEFGYRDSMIGGNLNNYNTFENLSSGLRLFDYTLNMRSINHQGLFFDNLSFSNFGYGGDPNDVSRLHIDKNKWYDFRAMFRRDKDFWNYNLLANPLNPAVSPIPNAAITNSPQALDLSRRMQDYDLTLFPQSRLRFRLGYSRNVDDGPASTTVEGGTEPLLSESVNYITNSYRMGVDYRGLSKTTLSFDEMLTYSAIDNSATDKNLSYQLSNGTPVDLGLVFVGTTPCANPITNATTTPPTVTSNCNGYLSYSQIQNPRSSFPDGALQLSVDVLQEPVDVGLSQLQQREQHGLRIQRTCQRLDKQDAHAREHDRRASRG